MCSLSTQSLMLITYDAKKNWTKHKLSCDLIMNFLANHCFVYKFQRYRHEKFEVWNRNCQKVTMAINVWFFWTYSIPILLQLCSKAPKTGDPVLSTLKNTLMYDTTWFWSRRTHTQYLSLFKILQSKLSKCRVVPPWAQACWIQGRS